MIHGLIKSIAVIQPLLFYTTNISFHRKSYFRDRLIFSTTSYQALPTECCRSRSRRWGCRTISSGGRFGFGFRGTAAIVHLPVCYNCQVVLCIRCRLGVMLGLSSVCIHVTHGNEEVVLGIQRKYIALSLHGGCTPEATGQHVVDEWIVRHANAILPLKTE